MAWTRWLAIAGVLAWCPSRAAVIDRVAAIVNNDVIALSEVYDQGSEFIAQACASVDAACVSDKEREVLDRLIEEVLVKQKLAEIDMDLGAADIERGTAQVVKQSGAANSEALREMVEKEGWEWETFKQYAVVRPMRLQRFQQLVIAPQVNISDDDIRDYYNRTVRDMPSNKRREIAAVRTTLSAESTQAVEQLVALAENVDRINRGEQSWAEYVAERNGAQAEENPTASMGVFGSDDLAAFFDPVFEAEVQQAVGPIRVKGEAFVLMALSEIAGDIRSFEDSKAELKQTLFAKAVEEETERWYRSARLKAVVKILLE